MKKTIKRYEMEEFWYEIASQRYENTLKGMKMMSDGMKKYQRYEIKTQGMK
jgi:hypothetical protein